jgi:hypothetical protein
MSGDGDLTHDKFREMMLRVDSIVNPWAAFVGLITLQRSTYCAPGISYAVDPSRTDFTELGQQFIMHPDDVEPARRSIEKVLNHKMTDAELAAWLWWHAKRKEAE